MIELKNLSKTFNVNGKDVKAVDSVASPSTKGKSACSSAPRAAARALP